MSGYLSRLCAQANGGVPAIAPRATSVFETPLALPAPAIVSAAEPASPVHLAAGPQESTSERGAMQPMMRHARIEASPSRPVTRPGESARATTGSGDDAVPRSAHETIDARGPAVEAHAPVLAPLRRFDAPPSLSPPVYRARNALVMAAAPAENAVQISIGRVEVKVADPPAKPARPPRAGTPALSLEDYLRSRR